MINNKGDEKKSRQVEPAKRAQFGENGYEDIAEDGLGASHRMFMHRNNALYIRLRRECT